MKRTNITIPKTELADFCRKHHIRRMALFGSVLRDDFTADSDIDVLVVFESDHIPGLAFFSMEAELAVILGHRVELHTPGFLSHYFRDQVISEAEIQYDATS